jgi:iron complex outermembrane receptor protein
MYRYLLFVIAVITTYSSSAFPGNNTLHGVVKDKPGIKLPGAIVEIPDLKIGTVTDTDGSYTLTNLPKGRFMVTVNLISYSKATILVNINGDTHQDFVLSESAIEAHEVVVTGHSKATEIKRSPTPVSVINSQYLRTEISTNIVDAIAKVPGVAEVTTGPNVSKPFIRGLGYNRVLSLYNGMRQEGQQWGDEHGIEVDEYNIDRVELVKGPSSLVYGSDAMAGVINFISTPHATDGKTTGEVLGEYQGNNGLIGGSAMLTSNRNGFHWLGRVSHKQATNYQDPIDGRVYGTSYNETDASGALGVDKQWGFAHLDLTLYNDLQAIPDGSRDSASRKFTRQITDIDTVRQIVPPGDLNSYTIPTVHQLVQHYRVLSSNSYNMGGGRIALNMGFERSVRREFSHPEFPETPGLYLELNSYTYDLKYHFASIKGWEITTGINGMYQVNNATKGTEFIIPSYHQFDLGPFALVEKTMDKLNFLGGIRFDSRTYNNDALYTRTDSATGFDNFVQGNDTVGAYRQFAPYSHTFSGFTYSLGLSYIFSKRVAVKANIARGFRAPNISEISSNGVHPGTSIYQVGNPNFKPEFSLQEDLGMEFTSEHLSVNVAVFNNDLTNFIYNQKVLNSQGQDSVIVPGNQTFQFVAAGARLYGGEADIDIHPHPLDWLHFENSISLVYGQNKGVNGVSPGDSAKYLPFIPPLHTLSELRANFKHPFKHTKNAFVKVQFLWFANQNRAYTAYNTETPTPGYTLFNAGLGTDIVDGAGNTLFNVSVFGNNLFDVAYQDHLSRLKYFEPYPTDPRGHSGIYNIGRNIGIKISVPLNVK